MTGTQDIGIYIHIPFCVRKCRYCDFASWSGMESIWEPYIRAVVRELELKSETAAGRRVMSLFIGGGTPSLLPYAFILSIMDAVRRHYRLLPDAEITIEANPGTLDEDKVKAYLDAGINRLSIGLQAYQDRLLKFLGRVHTARQFDEAVSMAQRHGFSNINADIIFGIPHQTMDDWLETLSRVLSHRIPHVSCYSLTIEEDTPFGRMKREGKWQDPDEELERSMYHTAMEMLGEAGLEQYELSNAAKPHHRCRHNMNYWQRGEYLGFGAAAHSFHNCQRSANTSDIRLYMERMARGNPVLDECYPVPDEEGLSESMILGLRLTEGVDLDELSTVYHTDVRLKYREKLEKLAERKLVELEGSVVRLTKRGMDLANQVFVEFI